MGFVCIREVETKVPGYDYKEKEHFMKIDLENFK